MNYSIFYLWSEQRYKNLWELLTSLHFINLDFAIPWALVSVYILYFSLLQSLKLYYEQQHAISGVDLVDAAGYSEWSNFVEQSSLNPDSLSREYCLFTMQTEIYI